MEVKCDVPMKIHKMGKRRGGEGFWCRNDCERCICAMKKLPDGTWEHIKPEDREKCKLQEMI